MIALSPINDEREDKEILKVTFVSSKKWLSWILATVPMVVALGLPELFSSSDLRASGQMTLIAVTPDCGGRRLAVVKPEREVPPHAAIPPPLSFTKLADEPECRRP